MVDTLDLGSSGESCGGSSPFARTIHNLCLPNGKKQAGIINEI
jgi:hypothetical protein